MSKHDKILNEKAKRELGKKGLTVLVRTGSDGKSDIGTALRTLKKRIDREELTKELREKEFHQTKGQIRRKAKKEAVRRYRQDLAKAKAEMI